MLTVMMLRKLLVSWLAIAPCVSACAHADSAPPTIEVGHEVLTPGGVFITHVNGCERGCDALQRGDLVLALNGEPVAHARDLAVDKVATGAPVHLQVRKGHTGAVVDVELVARPSDELPPIVDAPPFWSVGAADLDRAPEWARRNLFGHASPMIMLANADGGIVDGRQLYGEKRMLVVWDYGTRVEYAQAINALRVLQKARADLDASGVHIMFTQLRLPTNQRTWALNDTDLRAFQKKFGLPDHPPLPIYRFPNGTEFLAAREVGLEGAMTYRQYIRQSPTIILLDADGIVRWHSEGVQTPPPGDPLAGRGIDDEWTLIQAIEFAKSQL
jgi:hypothetical protein